MKLYHLFAEPQASSRLHSWEQFLGDFNEVVGYTSLGMLLLRCASSKRFAVLYPLKEGNNAKVYGPFDDVETFRSRVLEDPGFIDYCLKPDSVKTLNTTVGPLQEDEVYYPVPFPVLGGSESLDSYKKGNVWVFAELAKQSLDKVAKRAAN